MKLYAHVVTAEAVGVSDPEIIIIMTTPADKIGAAHRVEQFPLGEDNYVATLHEHGYRVVPDSRTDVDTGYYICAVTRD